MVEQQLALFNYASLDAETCTMVQKRTFEIKLLMRRTAQDIIEIGLKLIEVKAKLGHGNFENWLKTEFDWTQMTASRFMNVAEHFKTNNLLDLKIGPSALYLLASPSTPEFAREEALNRAEIGETITYTTAREIVDWHKGQAEQTTPTIQSFDTWANDPNPPYEIEEDLPNPTPTTPFQPQSMTLLTSSQNDSWRTPTKYIETARLVLGGIDLDPASSAIANQTVKAKYILTKEDNGLNHPWFGTVWINPPYGKTNNLSNRGLFAHKLVTEYIAGHVTAGIILVNLYTGYGWFAPLRELHRCEADHRISFINPSTDEEGDEAKASSVFIYVGPNPELFYKEFSQFGVCGQLKYFK
jgi:phage N-6-adenine-methyltransferase